MKALLRCQISYLLNTVILFGGTDFAALQLARQTQENPHLSRESNERSLAVAKRNIKCPQLDAYTVNEGTDDDQEFPFFYIRHQESY